MGMVATAFKNAVLVLTAIWVAVLVSMAVCLIVASTTRPLGMGMVVLASLLLGAVIQALTPILVAVLASMASAMINGFSTLPIGVVVAALISLGLTLALVGLVQSRF
jgi:hypothetical protein